MDLETLDQLAEYESDARSFLNRHWQRIVRSQNEGVAFKNLGEPLTEFERSKLSDPKYTNADYRGLCPYTKSSMVVTYLENEVTDNYTLMMVTQLAKQIKDASVVDGRCTANVYEKDGAIVLQLTANYIAKEPT